jgi:hypothetical protein
VSFSSSSCTECIPVFEDWNELVVPGKVLAMVLSVAVSSGDVVAPRVELGSFDDPAEECGASFDKDWARSVASR